MGTSLSNNSQDKSDREFFPAVTPGNSGVTVRELNLEAKKEQPKPASAEVPKADVGEAEVNQLLMSILDQDE